MVHQSQYGTSIPIWYIKPNMVHQSQYGTSIPIWYINPNMVYQAQYGISSPIWYINPNMVHQSQYGTSIPIWYINPNMVYQAQYGTSIPIWYINPNMVHQSQYGTSIPIWYIKPNMVYRHLKPLAMDSFSPGGLTDHARRLQSAASAAGDESQRSPRLLDLHTSSVVPSGPEELLVLWSNLPKRAIASDTSNVPPKIFVII